MRKITCEHTNGSSDILAWDDYVKMEDHVISQAADMGRLPFVCGPIRLMPDAHWGIGAAVGSVMATKRASVPAAVGVDIGCGMAAVRTSLVYEDLLTTDFKGIRRSIERVVPTGRHSHRGTEFFAGTYPGLVAGITDVVEDHPAIMDKCAADCISLSGKQFGTLGGGNHFIEVCIEMIDGVKDDPESPVWIVLHSGSRGIGNRIGRYFTKLAQSLCNKWFVDIPNKDLAYLPDDTSYGVAYLDAVRWAQEYAMLSRKRMLDLSLGSIMDVLPSFEEKQRIDCHHNFIDHEHHHGANVMVTRKGAVRARIDDWVIIPGSMGQKTYIGKGLQNDDSLHSCSHGAGRAMSRSQAKRQFTVADLIEQTSHVECRKDGGVLDEIPSSYKNIDDVMSSQKELVAPVFTLTQKICVKGG